MGQRRSPGYPHPIHDPFDQVRASKHALLEKLKEHPALGHARVPAGHGAIFPDCATPHRPLDPDAVPQITVFADDMPRLGDRVDAWASDIVVLLGWNGRPSC